MGLPGLLLLELLVLRWHPGLLVVDQLEVPRPQVHDPEDLAAARLADGHGLAAGALPLLQPDDPLARRQRLLLRLLLLLHDVLLPWLGLLLGVHLLLLGVGLLDDVLPLRERLLLVGLLLVRLLLLVVVDLLLRHLLVHLVVHRGWRLGLGLILIVDLLRLGL